MNKKLFLLVFLLMICLITVFSGCEISEQTNIKKSENLITSFGIKDDEEYKDFDNVEKIASEDDGYIEAYSNWKTGQVKRQSFKIDGGKTKIRGSNTVLCFDVKEKQDSVVIESKLDIREGDCKIVLVDPEKSVFFIENGKNKVNLQEGRYKLRVIGKPAIISDIKVTVKNIDKSNVELLDIDELWDLENSNK